MDLTFFLSNKEWESEHHSYKTGKISFKSLPKGQLTTSSVDMAFYNNIVQEIWAVN